MAELGSILFAGEIEARLSCHPASPASAPLDVPCQQGLLIFFER
jgi:hypothetical protein